MAGLIRDDPFARARRARHRARSGVRAVGVGRALAPPSARTRRSSDWRRGDRAEGVAHRGLRGARPRGQPALGLDGQPPSRCSRSPRRTRPRTTRTGPALRGKGGPVTRARLALWWGAVARDLVLLLSAARGRSLAASWHPRAACCGRWATPRARRGKFGLPLEVVDEGARGLRARAPARAGAARAGRGQGAGRRAAAAPPTRRRPPPGGPLRLEGIWSGSETDGGTGQVHHRDLHQGPAGR